MSSKTIASFLKKSPTTILMLDKPAAYNGFEVVDREDIGKDLFNQLKKLESETLDFERAFKVRGDQVLIATDVLLRILPKPEAELILAERANLERKFSSVFPMPKG